MTITSMQNFIKAFLAFVCLSIISISAKADEFEVGQFRYEVISYEFPSCRLIGATEPISGEIVIPDKVTTTAYLPEENFNKTYDMLVIEIGDCAFAHCQDLTSVTFGKNILRIGNEAFVECTLDEVKLNEKLQYIGDYAFAYNSHLHHIALPNNVIEIGYASFQSDEWLEVVTFGESLEKIGSQAFNCCSNLIEITFNNNLKSIGELAFSGCKLLQNHL